MTEHDHGNGWTEYRLLVTAMIERHEETLAQHDSRFHEHQRTGAERDAQLKQELLDHCDTKFTQ
ncbi:MAG: hypothetical protein KAI64_00925, partial [Thermoplasmata archaeon]|nr:hypothetical protein [Thermoplasmata archaeon]